MKPEVGDRVRFRPGNEMMEGVAEKVSPTFTFVRCADGKRWMVDNYSITIIEDSDA